MSQTQSFTLSPAVVTRIVSFAAELDEAAQQAGYLWFNASNALDRAVLEQARMALEGASGPLLEALGGEQDDEKDLSPLPRAVPHFLPQALYRVRHMGIKVNMLGVLCLGKEQEERLALEFFAGQVDYLLETARCLGETVLEELPEVKTFDYSSMIPPIYA